MIPSNELEKEIESMHSGSCPKCKGEGPNDLYTAKKVTGMILAVQWSTDTVVGCASCGKKMKYKTLLHCLFFGWWSPKAFLTNIFYIPYNLVSALFLTKSSMKPSSSLENIVCMLIAQNNMANFVANYRKDKKA